MTAMLFAVVLLARCGTDARVRGDAARSMTSTSTRTKSAAPRRSSDVRPAPQVPGSGVAAPVKGELVAADAESKSAIAVILDVFGAKWGPSAVRVAACESAGDTAPPWRLDIQAVNGSHAGLFQISRRWHEGRARRLRFAWNDLFTARPNARVARDLFDEQGWGPWVCRWAA